MVVLALLVAPASSPAQAAPSDPGTIPGVDEIVSSPNLKQVAHLPKTGPFANSTNSDWAFQGKYAYGGNYNGFAVYDISNPKAPTVAAQVLCPGSQNDISVHGKLLFLEEKPTPQGDGNGAVVPWPDEMKPGRKYSFFFGIPKKYQDGAGKWKRAIIVAGSSSKGFDAKVYPKDDLAKFEFAEKAALAKP